MDLDTPPLPKSHSTSRSPTPSTRSFRPAMPYDTPIPSGRCAFAELPEEVLEQVLLRLDLHDLTRCFRLNRTINEFMTTSTQINLRQTLLASSMRLNPEAIAVRPGQPHQVPITSATMLSTLRERLTRFQNLKPKETTSMQLAEGEGRLYEYLEGVLLRSVADAHTRSRVMAVYDLRTMDDWEDIEDADNAEVEQSLNEDERNPQTQAEASAAASASVPPQQTTTATTAGGHVETDVPADWSDTDDEGDFDMLIIDEDDDGLDSEFDDAEEGDDEDFDDEEAEWHSAMGTDSDSDEQPSSGSFAPGTDDGAVGAARINNTDPTLMGVRRQHSFDFNIMEMAVDPGQDLLVLVSVRARHGHPLPVFIAYLHLFSLTTFEPHPEATMHMLQWPHPLARHGLSLDFQICDDNLFVLMHTGQTTPDQLAGWNWRKGKQTMTLTSSDAQTSFSCFVLLSPSSFVIPTMRTILNMDRGDQLTEDDLDFTHHLELYAFPEGESPDEPYEATHVATIDLPRFSFNLSRGVMPVRMSVRTDPPPRQSFPSYPLNNPSPFMPDPTSGIAIFDIHAPELAPNGEPPHYVLFMHKTTLLRYMPAPTSPLLKETWSRPAPVITWDKIAPYSRLLGPDLEQPNWVCYVYQNRFVTIEDKVVDTVIPAGDEVGPGLRVRPHLVMYDFDPLRVRKERLARKHRLPPSVSRDDEAAINEAVQGDVDGIELVLDETTLPAELRLRDSITTGKHLPFIKVSRPLRGGGPPPVPLIDSERIIIVREGHRRVGKHGGIEIMQF